MMGLSDIPTSFTIAFAVWTQYRRWTSSQQDTSSVTAITPEEDEEDECSHSQSATL